MVIWKRLAVLVKFTRGRSQLWGKSDPACGSRMQGPVPLAVPVNDDGAVIGVPVVKTGSEGKSVQLGTHAAGVATPEPAPAPVLVPTPRLDPVLLPPCAVKDEVEPPSPGLVPPFPLAAPVPLVIGAGAEHAPTTATSNDPPTATSWTKGFIRTPLLVNVVCLLEAEASFNDAGRSNAAVMRH
jgi:hypothetical protein